MTTNQQRGDGASGDPRPLTEPQQLPNDNDLGPLPDADESAQTELGQREQGIRTERSNDISSPQLTGSDNRDSTPREDDQDEAAVPVGDGVDEGVQDTVKGPDGSLAEPD
jgi:hypothetical protein